MLPASSTNIFYTLLRKSFACFIALSLFFAAAPKADSPAAPSSAPSSSGSTPAGPATTRFFVYGAYGFYSGVSTTSFAGESETVGGFALEQRSGALRFFGSMECDIMHAQGLTLGTATTASKIQYVAFKLQSGFRVFPISTKEKGGFEPFISVGGSFSRGGVNVTPSTAELETFFRPNLYGYEISLGVDLKSSRSYMPVLRPRIAYSVEQGPFSRLTGFLLTRIEFHLGIGF